MGQCPSSPELPFSLGRQSTTKKTQDQVPGQGVISIGKKMSQGR